ncbi:phage protein [[Clostridium] sordellii]|uniref:phage tail terminator family protein n=1 Tax=Paraclostridium sordellii TaxID=1505 RepID=UPI0005DDB79C|nr:hypothetical protein [Paeniclostridium sordellii]CEQ08670.1 phage protein [[Clostridium] sordellii] [Paeniclostridium sordellii]
MKIDSGTIISLITKILKQNFPECYIYKDKKIQGLKKPCFFVFKLNSEQVKYNKDIFKQSLLVNIRYINDQGRTEFEDVDFKVQEILSCIDQDNFKLAPKNIKSEIIDDALQIFISYNIRILKEQETKSKMGGLNINGGVK